VLRALAREKGAAEAFFDEVSLAARADARLDALVAGLRRTLGSAPQEAQARRLVEQMAVALQASLLVRHAPAAVADAFCATRVAGGGGATFGTLPAGTSTRQIVDRHAPDPG
jgi:putative acyl-CoA dehydrogenase